VLNKALLLYPTKVGFHPTQTGLIPSARTDLVKKLLKQVKKCLNTGNLP